MFTQENTRTLGNGPADIIRLAEERAAAKESPMTFVGKEHVSMPREIQRCLPEFKTLSGDAMKILVDRCMPLFRGQTAMTFKEEQLEVGQTGLRLLTAIYLILRAAVRQRVQLDRIYKDLKALGFTKDSVTYLAEFIHDQRFALEEVARIRRIRYPRLSKLRWRVDIVLSSSTVKSVLEPSILLELTLSDGRVKRIELSIETFHVLRYNVAKVLHHMGTLERHPMIQIMQVLEHEERKRL